MKWYVVQVKNINIAIDQLKAQGFKTYAPKLKIYKRDSVKEVLMFGYYLFIKLNLKKPGWQSVNNTKGVRRIICMHPEKPSPLPVGFIEMIKEIENQEPPKPESFKPGDRVKIIDGPLSGYEGICSNSTSKRVSILLHLLGGETSVSVPNNNLQKVSEQSFLR